MNSIYCLVYPIDTRRRTCSPWFTWCATVLLIDVLLRLPGSRTATCALPHTHARARVRRMWIVNGFYYFVYVYLSEIHAKSMWFTPKRNHRMLSAGDGKGYVRQHSYKYVHLSLWQLSAKQVCTVLVSERASARKTRHTPPHTYCLPRVISESVDRRCYDSLRRHFCAFISNASNFWCRRLSQMM